MSLDELRATLRDHAGEVDPRVDPVPAVRARIRRRARAKTVALAGVVVAAVVAAATVLPGVLPGRNALPAQRPSPAPTATATLKTSVFKVGFPTRVNGDPLIASYVGPKGPSTGSFTFTATGHLMIFRPVCKLPRWVFGQITLSPPMLAIWVNGRVAFGVSCSALGTSSESNMPSRFAPISAGHTVTVKLAVMTDASGIAGKHNFARRVIADAQLALGIYDYSGPVRTKAGITLPVIYRTPGRDLHLHAFDVQRLTSKVRDLHATLPASSHSIVAVIGGGQGNGIVRTTTTVNGHERYRSFSTTGLLSYTNELSSRNGRSLVVQHAGRGVTGTLVFAYYSK